MEIELLKGDWSKNLADLLQVAQDEVTISSPFVTVDAVRFVLAQLPPSFSRSGRVRFLTNLSPHNLLQGATDAGALQEFARSIPHLEMFHLPRLHAKAYISDSHHAIITSGNLTLGGLRLNFEYGVLLKDPDSVRRIREDIAEYSALGAKVTVNELANYCLAADEARVAFRQQQDSMSRAARETFERALRAASDQLIRLRLADGPIHSVFERTIFYLLKSHLALTTHELYSMIEDIHPDLCDRSVDRIIGGHNFGPKWKHALRTAQQQLKKKGLVQLVDDKWTLLT